MALLALAACSSISKGLESSWSVSAGEPGTLADAPPLIRAMRFDDWDRAATLIARGVGAGERILIPVDSSPVEIAAGEGRLELVKALVEAGWIGEAEGEIAMMRAAQAGKAAIVEYLIGKGYRAGVSLETYRYGMATKSPAAYELFLRVPHPKFSINGYANSVFTEGNPTPGTLLSNIAIIGATPLIEPALGAGAKLETKAFEYLGYQGVRPLWLAVAAGRTETALALLAAGAVPDATDKINKYTPLMVACITGNLTAAERLVAAGADVNAKSATKYLAGASFNESRQVLSVSIADLKQRTPLILAAENGRPELVRLLLASGADPLFRNDEGWSAMDAARLYMDPVSAGMLLAAGVEENPLITAICAGNEKTVRTLLPSLAEYAGTKKHPVYPFQLAVRWYSVTGSKAVIDALLEAKDKLSGYDIERALRIARSEDEELFLYLYAKGLALNTPTYDSGYEILRALARRGDAAGFKAAWKTASPDLDAGQRNRLLSAAVTAGSVELARFMLDGGADANAYWFQDRLSLLGKAAATGSLELTKLLADNGAEINPKLSKIGWVVYPFISPLMAAAETGNAPIVRYLLGKGASVNEIGFEGRSALAYAVLSGDVARASALLDAGADVNVRMSPLVPGSITTKLNTGETPLMLAAKADSVAMLSLLLERKADFRFTDWIGDDALLIAYRSGKREAERALTAAMGSRYP
jgi:ankyrin repeat protein